MEEILRVYRMVNPSCTATPISASSSPQKDLKDIVPAVDAQELSQSLIENMNRAFNCITNTKHPTSNQTNTYEDPHQQAVTMSEKVFIPKLHGRRIKGYELLKSEFKWNSIGWDSEEPQHRTLLRTLWHGQERNV
ncbi:hypothetical protein Y032_0217g2408 [Ancylostoma ceylanicum]|nr:hypothetical protein Y032_0217g2408 [Ancylostoma ceylanicum]